MTWAALAVLSAYLIGSLSGSLLLGRLIGVDIRTRGSGNAGGTNALRTVGWRFALAVVAIDVGKGALAAGLPWLLPEAAGIETLELGYACALAAAIGHTWPLFHGFRGGKGAGTLAGALLVVWPVVVPALLAVWLITLAASGYVGLATVAAAVALPLAAWLLPGADAARAGFAGGAAVLLVFTHRHNLVRLVRGTEYRFERARLLRWRGRE
ncbi:MAG TPA: glycerol-3-phosphate 1-O-acyltransferase PlsY [Xanthomonadaceae bacterium]|nr:glycerol-3-phosphate 1-O-acyltransferase PlsY [Xanthomonadaceae bacterium]